MIELGIFTAKDGKNYAAHFFPDKKEVEVVGPLPFLNRVGARGLVYTVRAESEQEAKQKVTEAIDHRKF